MKYSLELKVYSSLEGEIKYLGVAGELSINVIQSCCRPFLIEVLSDKTIFTFMTSKMAGGMQTQCGIVAGFSLSY